MTDQNLSSSPGPLNPEFLVEFRWEGNTFYLKSCFHSGDSYTTFYTKSVNDSSFSWDFIADSLLNVNKTCVLKIKEYREDGAVFEKKYGVGEFTKEDWEKESSR